MTEAENKYIEARKQYLATVEVLNNETDPEKKVIAAWDARRFEAAQLRAHIDVYAERLKEAGITTDMPNVSDVTIGK